jgi:hypothetical protein
VRRPCRRFSQRCHAARDLALTCRDRRVYAWDGLHRFGGSMAAAGRAAAKAAAWPPHSKANPFNFRYLRIGSDLGLILIK